MGVDGLVVGSVVVLCGAHGEAETVQGEEERWPAGDFELGEEELEDGVGGVGGLGTELTEAGEGDVRRDGDGDAGGRWLWGAGWWLGLRFGYGLREVVGLENGIRAADGEEEGGGVFWLDVLERGGRGEWSVRGIPYGDIHSWRKTQGTLC